MEQRHIALYAILSGLIMVFSTNLARAGDFSIGASAVRASVKVQDAGTQINGDSSGYRVFGVYMFNRNFGIEGGVSSYRSPDDNTIPVNMEVESEGYDLYAVAAYPVSENVGFIAKAGFAAFTTETEVDDTAERNFRSTDLALSLGGQYDFSERLAFRGEFNWFDAATKGAEDVLSFGVLFRF